MCYPARSACFSDTVRNAAKAISRTRWPPPTATAAAPPRAGRSFCRRTPPSMPRISETTSKAQRKKCRLLSQSSSSCGNCAYLSLFLPHTTPQLRQQATLLHRIDLHILSIKEKRVVRGLYLSPCRITLFYIYTQFAKGLLRLLGIKFAVAGQPRKCRCCD